MIKPAQKTYDPPEMERKIQQWWEEARIYEKVKEKRSDRPPWYFLDGPPYASGAIHLGTAWNKIIKDVVLRYKTMRGLNVRRQPGWDCHGLPIEVMVEEKLGIKSKKDIERVIGVERFVEECKRWAMNHVELMTKQFKRLGIWMDWESPYMTLKNDYIESAWWTLKLAYEKGLLRKDLRVIHWCPRCETALAEHEVRGEYYDIQDPSLFAKFKIRDRSNEYLLIWTTTPWTIPANMAVCVHPDYDYARVKVGEEVYVMAKALVSRVMGELGISDYEILETMEGKELEGIGYEHPLIEEVPKQKEFLRHHRVICGNHVSLEEGTGCVHTAPGFGEEDFIVGVEYGLPVFSPVGPDGRFTEDAGKYCGLFVKDADPLVLGDLRRKRVLLKHAIITHAYPHCWRCKTPLIFRATEQWFLKVSEIKSRILEGNEKVRWVPTWMKGRYTNGVKSVGDWCLSRQRYWGIPFPIWTCGGCRHSVVVGSVEELRKLTGEAKELDLHRSDLDKLRPKCPKCGSEMRRIPEVLDVWFDSSIASWASLGFPKGEELFKNLWPSSFITEGEDQVTKWFYAQQVSSVIAFGEVPYKLVLTHGFALDAQGRKMSKSLGNVVDPIEMAERYGADVLRMYILSANPPWEDLRFNLVGLRQVSRTLNILWNAYVFATTYMSLDSFDPRVVNRKDISRNFLPEDRWMLSRVNTTIKEVTEALERLELHVAARTLMNFILEDLSRWYIRSIRQRTWIEKEHPSKLSAYVVLYETLDVLIRLLAPFIPHMCEVMYSGLIKSATSRAPESIHMLDWPTPDESLIDVELEKSMALVRLFGEAVAEARQKAKLKLRWPVQEVVIKLSNENEFDSLEKLRGILKERANCKILNILRPGDPEPVGEYSVVQLEHGKVMVSKRMTPELKGEAMARELVRRLQVMRKEKDLQMEERVDVMIGVEDAEFIDLLKPHLEYIKREVRVRELRVCHLFEVEAGGYTREWDLDGKHFKLRLDLVI